MEYEISNRLSGVHGSMIRELFKLGASKDIISFGGGNPSAETFPCREIEEIAAKGLGENPVSLLQYGLSEGVGYKLKTQNPDKTFYYPDRLPVCPNMKKNTLEKILHVLKTGENEVHVSDALRENSKKPLEKMLELAAK